MRRIICIALLMSFCFIRMSFAETNLVETTANPVVPIKEALVRWICYQNNWLGTDYKLGVTLSLEIKVDKEKFFAWINDLPAKDERYHFAVFYTGEVNDGRGAVINSQGYNKELPPTVYDLKNRRQLESGAVIKDTLTLPSDCTPKYDPTTPQKELMIKTIVSSMQNTFSRWIKTGIAKYPKDLTIVIADFNIDYPRTYVLVEPINKVYSVTLHDPEDYDKIEDEYLFDEEYNKSDDLLTKIRKHGIIRKITLDP